MNLWLPLYYHFVLFGITFCSSLFFTNYTHFLNSKKLSFLTIRCVSWCLVLSVLYQLYGLMSTSIFVVSQDYFTLAFRIDLIGQILLFISTGLFLYFFTVLKTLLAYTKWSFRYLLEIPNIMLLLFLCIQLFLLADDLIVLVLTLELITFSVLVLFTVSFSNETPNCLSLEAAVKYFVFNGFSMGFLWLAIVGYFAVFKNLNLSGIASYGTLFPELTYLYGNTLVVFHFLFFFAFLIKLGSGPMHFWLPDVYEGAETLITALLVLLIAPVFLIKLMILLKVFMTVHMYSVIHVLLLTLGIISVTFGTFGAFSQKKIKRFLAFAGLTHFGFMFICLSNLTLSSFLGVVIYLVFYICMNLVFFSLLLLIQRHTTTAIIYFTQLRSLFVGNNLIFYLALCTILSFAGLPPFAGFFSKAFVLYVLVKTQNLGIVVFLVCTILVNVYLYLRILKIAIFERLEAMRLFVVPTITGNVQDVTYLVNIMTRNVAQPWTRTSQQVFGFLTICVFLIGLVIVYFPSLLLLFTKFVQLFVLMY